MPQFFKLSILYLIWYQDTSCFVSMGRAVFETDCLGLQQASSSDSSDRGPLGVLFREAKFLLTIGFIDTKSCILLGAVTAQRMCWLRLVRKVSRMAK
jgi:hypothetical protein